MWDGSLGRRFPLSRDPEDDILLATAHAGRARYLVTNDRDLLEIPAKERRGFRFDIVKPVELLRLLEIYEPANFLRQLRASRGRA